MKVNKILVNCKFSFENKDSIVLLFIDNIKSFQIMR